MEIGIIDPVSGYLWGLRKDEEYITDPVSGYLWGQWKGED